jgi:hypothetical protein
MGARRVLAQNGQVGIEPRVAIRVGLRDAPQAVAAAERRVFVGEALTFEVHARS